MSKPRNPLAGNPQQQYEPLTQSELQQNACDNKRIMTNPQPNKPTLDKTLKDFAEYVSLSGAPFGTMPNDAKKLSRGIQAIASAIDRLIIGEDEQEISPDGVKQYQGRMARNSLRRKQRQRLSRYVGEKK